MEQWENELRKKLEREVPDGVYQIGEHLWTGKRGVIDFEVEMRKAARGWSMGIESGLGVREQMEQSGIEPTKMSKMTEEKLKDILVDLGMVDIELPKGKDKFAL